MRLAILAGAVLVASCSHPPRGSKPRPILEPDDTRDGAVVVPLVTGKGVHRGNLDGPGRDTVDWLVVDRPAAPAGLSLVLRAASAEVWLRAFDGPDEIAVQHEPRRDDAIRFRIPSAPPRTWLEISDLEREEGTYELSIELAPPVEPAPLAVDAGSVDAPLRYCAVGEVSEECRRAPPCDWTKIDPENPRCAPDQRPR